MFVLPFQSNLWPITKIRRIMDWGLIPPSLPPSPLFAPRGLLLGATSPLLALFPSFWTGEKSPADHSVTTETTRGLFPATTKSPVGNNGNNGNNPRVVSVVTVVTVVSRRSQSTRLIGIAERVAVRRLNKITHNNLQYLPRRHRTPTPSFYYYSY